MPGRALEAVWYNGEGLALAADGAPVPCASLSASLSFLECTMKTVNLEVQGWGKIKR